MNDDATGTNDRFDALYPDVPPVMSTGEVAELLSLNPQIVRRYAQAEILPAHRHAGGRRWYFLRHEILAWVENLD